MSSVTPFVGVWIETPAWCLLCPSPRVTPFVGVWIETSAKVGTAIADIVTPFVGVWIETVSDSRTVRCTSSHPSWVCGLKLDSSD